MTSKISVTSLTNVSADKEEKNIISMTIVGFENLSINQKSFRYIVVSKLAGKVLRDNGLVSLLEMVAFKMK